MYSSVQQQDPELHAALVNEASRQRHKLELIASENYVSQAVLEAQGSILTNKYAEGYPGKRYYGGCEYVDVAEELARERVKQLFGAEYANVQPHSGSGANMAVYFTYLEAGDTVLGMDLSQGGHLTHGSPVNFSGRMYNFVPYGIDRDTGLIDYDVVADMARKHKPKMITVGASAYSRTIDYEIFRQIADQCGAFLFADIAHPAGLIAKGHLGSPVEFCDVVCSTTHKTLRGPRGGVILIGKDVENPFGKVAPKSGRTKMMSELLDSMVMPGIQGGPLMHAIAAKAVAFKEALSDQFGDYTGQVISNAQSLADALLAKDYNIISGGTENHLMLIDLRNKGLSGKKAENALDRAGITVNKNSVPFDDKSPLVTSGIRIGAAAVTTRGMRNEHMTQIAELIDRVISAPDDQAISESVKNDVSNLCSPFPIHAPSIGHLETAARVD